VRMGHGPDHRRGVSSGRFPEFPADTAQDEGRCSPSSGPAPIRFYQLRALAQKPSPLCGARRGSRRRRALSNAFSSNDLAPFNGIGLARRERTLPPPRDWKAPC